MQSNWNYSLWQIQQTRSTLAQWITDQFLTPHSEFPNLFSFHPLDLKWKEVLVICFDTNWITDLLSFVSPDWGCLYFFPKPHILDSSKPNNFAGDNFKLDENGGKFSNRAEKHCGKRRNCSSRAISPFSTVFSKDLYCRHVKTRACLRKG